MDSEDLKILRENGVVVLNALKEIGKPASLSSIIEHIAETRNVL